MSNFTCPTCGNDINDKKKINHIISGGNNTATVEVEVESCNKCGEILFSPQQIQLFDEVKIKLQNGQVDKFTPIGKNYKIA